jgi:RNA polymerase sigma factor (sigma-70 family)
MSEGTTAEAGSADARGGAGEHAVEVRTAAYAELYQERNKQLIAYASALTGNPRVAEDLVAEAHFRVWRRLRAGHEVRNVPAYLTTTVRNLAAGLGRDRRELAPDSSGPSAGNAAPDPALRASHVDLLARLLKELPDRWASALWYAEVEDLPMEAVGARIGAGASTAAVVLTRARERLRQAFLQSQPGTPAAEACAENWKLMPGLVRGSASARQSRRVADHAEGCADCRERLSVLTETNGRLPLILGPALLAGVLGGGGAWLMPSISGAARTGSKMARHARVKTGVLSQARARVFTKSLSPAKGVLVGSVGVVGVAAAAATLALGTATPHHDTAAATTATSATSPSSAATGSAGAPAGAAPSTVTAAAAAAAAPASSAASEGSASPDATQSPLTRTLQQSALSAAGLAGGQQPAQQFSPSLTSTTTTTTAPATAETTAPAATSGTTAPATTTSPTQTSSSPSASATGSASPSASASTSAGVSSSPSDTPTDSPSGTSASDSPTATATPTSTATATSTASTSASSASTSSSMDSAASSSSATPSSSATDAP